MEPKIFYILSIAGMGIGSAVSHWSDLNPARFGAIPRFIKLLANVSTLGWIAMLVAGFFLFPWSTPLIAVGIAFVLAPVVEKIAISSGFYPGVLMVTCIIGIGSSIATLITV